MDGKEGDRAMRELNFPTVGSVSPEVSCAQTAWSLVKH